MNNKPIPTWRELKTDMIITQDNNEPLVLLDEKESRQKGIVFEPKYYLDNIPGAISECYMRQEVLTRLYEAATLLPKGYSFKIFDAWRPYAVQKFLFDKQVKKIVENQEKNTEEATNLACRYVSKPSLNVKTPFVHATGGAIDLTIVDENHQELNMGTGFDAFSGLAATDSFEQSDNEDVKRNRRLLYNVMIAVGFVNYPSEWWHYDFGDAFWASNNNLKNTIYGGIYKI